MAVTFDFEFKSAFVLGNDAVRSIWTTLESIGAVLATARCADNARREFESISQLLDFKNPRAKELRSLQFSAESKDHKRYAHVAFGDQLTSSQISVTLSALEERELSDTQGKLIDAIDGTKAWYSFIARIDMVWGLFALLGGLWFVGRVMVGDASGPRLGVGFGQAVLVTVVAIGFWGMIGLFCWVIWRLHARYFPLAFFALGQGAERYQVDDKMRWVVIIGLVISVFGGSVASFFAG